MKKITKDSKLRRKHRIRGKIQGTKLTPKISVLRSNKNFFAQAIDDDKRVTIESCASQQVRKKDQKMTKSQEAKIIGVELAKKLLKKGIKKGVLDRGSYLYLGRVKAFTEGLREGGLQI